MDKPATPYGADHPTELSPPVPREEVHNRRVRCDGFVREDGLFDIEAEMTDNKSYPFPTEFRGDVTPDQYVHHMKVRVTVDRDMKVHAAEALTIAGPYAICPTANDVFADLVGLTIGPGWRRRVAAAIGGRAWLHPYHRIDGGDRHHRLPDPLWRRGATAPLNSCRDRNGNSESPQRRACQRDGEQLRRLCG